MCLSPQLKPLNAALLSTNPALADQRHKQPVMTTLGMRSEPLETNGPSRRLRIWDLAARLHCPIIGVCFSTDEVRRLMRRVPETHAMTDFELHTSMVCACADRNDGSRMIDRELNRRYKTAIQALARISSVGELLARWRTDTQNGRVAGALWASLTHPLCDGAAEDQIYADIHLLQHQNAALSHAGLRLARAERAELEKLRETLQQTRTQTAAATANHHEQIQRLTDELEQLKIERHAMRREQVDAMRHQRVDTAELSRMNQSLQTELQTLRRELSRLQRMHADAMAGNEALRGELAARTAPPEPIEATAAQTDRPDPMTQIDEHLAGQRVLCVGGMPRTIGSYRQAVEQLGARFEHHDGGLEQAMNRLDPALSGADVVVCQAGHISHGAYWRVKKHCRRTGKPCVYLESSGLSSFIEGLRNCARCERNAAPTENAADAMTQ